MKLAARSLACLCSALVASSLAAQGKVWVVDDVAGPGVDFTALQPCIAAASDGDTLLVKNGTYPRAVIDAKGLTVIAEAGALARVTADFHETPLVVRNLSAAQRLVLRGLSVVSTEADAVQIQNCAGQIWIEGCAITEQKAFGSYEGHGLRIQNAASVAATHCTLIAGTGAGARATGSNVFLYETSAAGGTPASCCWFGGTCCPGNGGYPGVRAEGGFLVASSVHLSGGSGGGGCSNDLFGCCGNGGPGGPGLSLLADGASAPEAHLLGASFAPGLGAPAANGAFAQFCTAGPNGPPIDGSPPWYEIVAGTPRSFSIGSPIRAGQSAQIQYAGQPGDGVFVAFQFNFDETWFPMFSGVLLPAYPPNALALGAAPAGTLALAIPFAPFPAGLDALHVYAQAFAIGTAGEMLLGAPSQLTVLNQLF